MEGRLEKDIVYLNGELDGSIKANEAVFLHRILDEIAIFNVGIAEAQGIDVY